MPDGRNHAMFNFKLNMRMLKVFLFFTVITFFMPLFSVSCGSRELSFSGFEISVGKTIGDFWRRGNFLGFIIILPPLVLLILSFLIYRIKRDDIYNIIKTAFFIVPVFDIFAIFIARTAFRAGLIIAIDRYTAENDAFLRSLANAANLTEIHIKFGFVLYIIFNAAVFVFAAVNYFLKREI